jgi:hypothetical protein
MTKKLSLRLAAPVLVLATFAAAPGALADTTTVTSTRGLQQALGGNDEIGIIHSHSSAGGFSLGGNLFSGRASGNEPLPSGYTSDPGLHDDRTAELEGDQRVYALLIDGSYDFNYDMGTGLPLHPYLSGGMGMAYGGSAPSAGMASMQGGDMVPLFRLGGGVTYRLGEKWNLSLDYKAGFSGFSDPIFTGRSQQTVDLSVLKMGMHFAF